MYKLLLIVILFTGWEVKAQTPKIDIPPIELPTIKGKKFVLTASDALCVVVFLSPSCPLSQKYTLTLNELAMEFQGKVKFYGVFAASDPELEEYKDFQKKYKIRFKLFVDRKKQLVKALAASVTPEAFVLHKGKVIYQGAIDDWAIALGKTKKTATVSFVKNSIQSTLQNTTPVLNYSKPIGCFID